MYTNCKVTHFPTRLRTFFNSFRKTARVTGKIHWLESMHRIPLNSVMSKIWNIGNLITCFLLSTAYVGPGITFGRCLPRVRHCHILRPSRQPGFAHDILSSYTNYFAESVIVRFFLFDSLRVALFLATAHIPVSFFSSFRSLTTSLSRFGWRP